jgi:threonine dehydratase
VDGAALRGARVSAPPPDPDRPPSPVTLADVRSAAARLDGVAHRTPVMTSRWLDDRAGGVVLLKCECFQRVGAFKFRGAYNAASRLTDEHRARGVLTYSSGNHAQALALAGALLEVPTVIVMPADAPRVKLEATRGYLGRNPAGGEIVHYDRATELREVVGSRIAAERGLTVIPPYDHPHVIAGQGTAGMELIEDAGVLDELYVCVGGGGLISGCAIAARALAPRCRVIGVEPAAGDDATRSFRDRTLHTVREPETIADGARTPSLGRWTFPLVLASVDEMMTVTDGELIEAMRICYERLKIVIEPTGALGLAGALQRACAPGGLGGKRVGILVSGGNVDVGRLGELFGGG